MKNKSSSLFSLKNNRTGHAFRLGAAVLAMASSSAWALDGTWNITTNGNWSTPGNWVGSNIADGAGAIGDFSQVNLSNNRIVTIDTPSRTLGILRLGDSTGATNSYTISSGTLIFNNNGSTAQLEQIATSGSNIISSSVSLVDNLSITNASPGNLTISGNLSGASSITYAGSGAGRLILSGVDNSGFTGNINISSGTMVHTTNLGSSNASNVISINSGATLVRDITGGSNSAITVAGFNDGISGGGTITRTSNGNRGFNLAGSGTYSFSGGIDNGTEGGTLFLTKTGAGTQSFNGTLANTGAASVSAGTLLINGSMASAVTVSGGVFGGTGTINNNVTINASGTLSAGSLADSTGMLTISGTLAINNGATSAFQGGDLVDVGTLDLNDNWTLSLGTGFVDGGTVTLFTFDTLAASPDLAPTFDLTGLGFAPTGPLTLSQVGNTIVLNGISVIPEPGSVALFGLGITCLLWRARRR